MPVVATLSLVAQAADLGQVRQFIEGATEMLGLDSETTAHMRMAVDEAVTNVLEHGYHNQPGRLELNICREQTDVIIYLSDEAPVFDPTQVPPPDLSIPAPLRPPGGMGLHFIRQALDELQHEALPDGGNRLIMIWRNVAPEA
ncbi:MAG: ATP-binding protein [Anaerolineae bacterium]|nr:ATP-binding protein [Anaerolineae bacterium]